MSALRAALTVKPFRGAVVAAGAVALAALVVLLQLRFEDVWGDGVLLAVAALPAAFTAALAVLAPVEGLRAPHGPATAARPAPLPSSAAARPAPLPSAQAARPAPRPYHSALYLVTLTLGAVALLRLAEALGADGVDSAGARMWTAAAVAALAAWFAVRRRSAVCALVAATAAIVALLAAVSWLLAPAGWSPYRWALLACVAGFVLGAVALRDRHGAHAVAVADAAGLAVVALAASFPAARLVGSGPAEPSWGWELVLLATSFGALAYSAVDRRPGPGWLGALALVLALLAAADVDRPSLLGWPLVVALGAGALLVVGLRPTTPAPPPPDDDAAQAATVALSELRRD